MANCYSRHERRAARTPEQPGRIAGFRARIGIRQPQAGTLAFASQHRLLHHTLRFFQQAARIVTGGASLKNCLFGLLRNPIHAASVVDWYGQLPDIA